MSCILNPALLMRCKESLGDVPDDRLDAGNHIQLGKVSFNAGDKLQIFIVYIPLGKYSPDGVAWTGTSSKCSSIGFIAHADNWTRSYGAIHPPARAYLEVGAGCTLEQTFTISVTEQLNIGIYAIINNGWANGYDNQCFLVEGYSIRKNGAVLYEAGDPTACLNFRKNGKNFTPVCRVASPTTTALKFRSRMITGPVTDTIPLGVYMDKYTQGSFKYVHAANAIGTPYVRIGNTTKFTPADAIEDVATKFTANLLTVTAGTTKYYQVQVITSEPTNPGLVYLGTSEQAVAVLYINGNNQIGNLVWRKPFSKKLFISNRSTPIYSTSNGVPRVDILLIGWLEASTKNMPISTTSPSLTAGFTVQPGGTWPVNTLY